MIYRRIRTACGSEVLEPLSEIEQAIYKRNKRNKKRKSDREEEVSAYIAGLFLLEQSFSLLLRGLFLDTPDKKCN